MDKQQIEITGKAHSQKMVAKVLIEDWVEENRGTIEEGGCGDVEALAEAITICHRQNS